MKKMKCQHAGENNFNVIFRPRYCLKHLNFTLAPKSPFSHTLNCSQLRSARSLTGDMQRVLQWGSLHYCCVALCCVAWQLTCKSGVQVCCRVGAYTIVVVLCCVVLLDSWQASQGCRRVLQYETLNYSWGKCEELTVLCTEKISYYVPLPLEIFISRRKRKYLMIYFYLFPMIKTWARKEICMI